jgi:SRSO17 transposase
VAAGHSANPDRWLAGIDDLLARVAGHVGRVEPRKRMRQFVFALMAGLPRTNCWSIAEHAGERCPRGMQRFLSQAVWDTEAVLDDVRAWVVEFLGDPDAVLVIDETGDVKKGSFTVGTQRQYTGTAGRIENSQVAVYLTYTSSKGHALIGRTLAGLGYVLAIAKNHRISTGSAPARQSSWWCGYARTTGTVSPPVAAPKANAGTTGP